MNTIDTINTVNQKAGAMLYFSDNFVEIHQGNALDVLRGIPDESVQCAITSPPYWGLRNYAGGADIVWGDNNCDHEWGDLIPSHGQSNWHSFKKQYHSPGSHKTTIGASMKPEAEENKGHGNFCAKCGAWQGQLGLEPEPELYVEHLMMVFREVRRVLRRDGCFFLNIGDTYVSGKGSCFNPGGGDRSWKSWVNRKINYPTGRDAPSRMCKSIPPKCMACIPERVLFAMLADGWILRNKIIWHKTNHMPSSQKDRFSQSWEYLYFFNKNDTPCLWRNRQTGEWRDKRPTKEENYPWGGMYYCPETHEYSWKREKDYLKIMPLWVAFDYYFELDAVRIPHKAESLERYQRGVNLGQPAEGKSGVVGPMQQYTRAPEWFKAMFPPDGDYKGKFDDLFSNGPQPQSFNLRVRDVKRGKRGTSAQGGELKASDQEVEGYEYPEKHHGSSMNNQDRLHKDRQYDSKYLHADYGQPLQGFQRDQTIVKARDESRRKAKELFPDDPEKQQEYINFVHDHQAHPKGKNPGDLWSISTKPSSISVCPKCEAVFPRLLKVCPNCKVEGIVGHFAPYPEALCVDPIKACSRVGDVVLDPFAGGGTTGVAAKKLGRRAILIDCVRVYCVMAKYKSQRVVYQPGMEAYV